MKDAHQERAQIMECFLRLSEISSKMKSYGSDNPIMRDYYRGLYTTVENRMLSFANAELSNLLSGTRVTTPSLQNFSH